MGTTMAIEQRANGKWQVTVTYRTTEGRKREKSCIVTTRTRTLPNGTVVAYKNTPTDAGKLEVEMKAAVLDGTFAEKFLDELPIPKAGATTVAQWWAVYRASCTNPNNEDAWAYNTRMRRDGEWENYIKDEWGDKGIDQPTPWEIGDWIKGLPHKGIKKNILGTMSVMFSAAVMARLRPDNPCREVRSPKGNTAEQAIPTLAQLRTVLDHLGDEMVPLILLMAFTGVRRGEAIGICRDDLDLIKTGTLHVHRQVLHPAGGEWCWAPTTKNKKDVKLTVDPYLLGIIRDHVGRYGFGGEDRLLFHNHGQPWRGDAVYRRFKKAARDAGLPYLKVHTLRHLHSSELDARGVDETVIAKRQNQSLAVNRTTYRHATEGAEVAVLAALADMHAELGGHLTDTKDGTNP